MITYRMVDEIKVEGTSIVFHLPKKVAIVGLKGSTLFLSENPKKPTEREMKELTKEIGVPYVTRH